MNFNKLFLLILALIYSASAIAGSDETLDRFLSLSFEDLVNLESSIATASSQPLSRAPAVVSVITADDIKATGAVNLVDALRAVPGLHIRMDPFGNRPLIHFRGSLAVNTLLMVNGNPMKDLMWVFGIFWKGLPASIIDRIEIIRGPGSALFGADAAAGVINVITKTAGKIEGTEAGLRIGSFNSKTGWLQHGGNINGFDFGLTANFHQTDGYSPLIATDRQTTQDQNFATNASLAPAKVNYGWRSEDLRLSLAKGNWRILADYMGHSDVETGMTGTAVIDPVTVASDSRYNIDLLYNNNTSFENWQLNSDLSFEHLHYSSGDGFQEAPPGYTDATGVYPDGLINQMESAERSLSFDISGLYSGFENHALRIGAGYSLKDLYLVKQRVNSGLGPDGTPLPAGGPLVDLSDTPYAFAPEKKREIAHLFIQDIWTISPDWELTTGARYDSYSDFGDTVNPRLALVWQTTDQLTSKIMYGRAFRAPSYQQLFSETSRALPNDELNAEEFDTTEVSFSYAATPGLQLSMNLFQLKQEGIIQRIPVTGSTKDQYENLGDHNTKGMELEVQWQARQDLRVSANYALQRQKDDEFRYYLIPERSAYLRADWVFLPNWNWDFQTNWIGDRPRPASDTRTALAAYAISDTTIRYESSQSWEFAASVRNVFDKQANEYNSGSLENDLPLPGRNIYVEMKYKF
jgi:outer membrane receptor for ferrienterochelin and colicin